MVALPGLQKPTSVRLQRSATSTASVPPPIPQTEFPHRTIADFAPSHSWRLETSAAPASTRHFHAPGNRAVCPAPRGGQRPRVPRQYLLTVTPMPPCAAAQLADGLYIVQVFERAVEVSQIKGLA